MTEDAGRFPPTAVDSSPQEAPGSATRLTRGYCKSFRPRHRRAGPRRGGIRRPLLHGLSLPFAAKMRYAILYSRIPRSGGHAGVAIATCWKHLHHVLGAGPRPARSRAGAGSKLLVNCPSPARSASVTHQSVPAAVSGVGRQTVPHARLGDQAAGTARRERALPRADRTRSTWAPFAQHGVAAPLSPWRGGLVIQVSLPRPYSAMTPAARWNVSESAGPM